MTHPLVVEEEVLHPQRAPLPDRRELRGLVVRETQGGHVLVLLGKLLQDGQRLDELLLHQLERLLQLDDVRVVPDVAARRPQVNDRHGLGRGVAEGVDVPHDVVAELRLVLVGLGEVDVVEVVLHLLDLLVGDVEAELLLGRGEGEPQLAPRGELHGGAEDGGHLLGGVSGVFVKVHRGRDALNG